MTLNISELRVRNDKYQLSGRRSLFVGPRAAQRVRQVSRARARSARRGKAGIFNQVGPSDAQPRMYYIKRDGISFGKCARILLRELGW